MTAERKTSGAPLLKFGRSAAENQPEPLGADPYLAPYLTILQARQKRADSLEKRLSGKQTLADFACAHEYYGLHFRRGKWIFREFAPHADAIFLVGDFSAWEKREEFRLSPIGGGVWEIVLPASALRHGMLYQMAVSWPGGSGTRLPAFARRVVQDDRTKIFTAQVWKPEHPYTFSHASPAPQSPLIYEAHIGMAQEKAGVGTFEEFRLNILPEIAKKGYNTVQLMAVMEHPYYGSFGYHVANFFAVSSRFGTPEEFKHLVDDAHALGLRVIIDLVHSHCVRNEAEGIALLDGCRETYFHAGARGEHSAWDSLCFDYGKIPVLHFLLSNCRFLLDEYQIDGFRFDGVTSMLYLHHGLNRCFTGYENYFSGDVDEDALTYLTLANRLIHAVRPDAVTVAEDVSGMPGLAAKEGIGFDYRMAMGVTDMWFKLLDLPDEKWNMFYLYGELTNRRKDERSISYVECHDQAIVGGKSAIFRMADAAMYDAMHRDSGNSAVDRAVALHKMMRLATAAAAGNGYLTFMGNEFGHPEWVDLPREGNQWSYQHARRQWSLEKDPRLRFGQLSAFDREITKIISSPDFYRAKVQCVRIDNNRQVVIFERHGFWFVFNFSPTCSWPDYSFEALAGEYSTVLDSDAPAFGGFSLREPDQHYVPLPGSTGVYLSLYLPARTALVLRRDQN